MELDIAEKKIIAKTFTLTLSQDEANVIRSLCCIVGGSGKNRRITDDIFTALVNDTQDIPICDLSNESVHSIKFEGE